MRYDSKNKAHHMSVSLSDFPNPKVFKGRLHATVYVVYFLYAFNVKTMNILNQSKNRNT